MQVVDDSMNSVEVIPRLWCWYESERKNLTGVKKQDAVAADSGFPECF